MSRTVTPGRKSPWHLWMVGVVALLWNASGAYAILLAQAGRLPDPEPDELAYYAAQPLWFVVVTDIALAPAIGAALGLLFRTRAAVWMYALSLGAIMVNNSYELASGTSQMLVHRAALVATVLIACIAVFELVYASAMKSRGVLQ